MTRVIRELLEALVLAMLVFLVVHVSAQNFRVVGASMENTLEEGEYLVVNKLVYMRIDMQRLAQLIPFWDIEEPKEIFAFHSPERGDVVVFHPPPQPEKEFVKRVVGLPGEEIDIRDGQVFIDELVLPEPYLPAGLRTERRHGRPDMFPLLLGEREYFVLGDNRRGSTDSRNWGPVPLEDIVGKVWLVYWPLSEFGTLPSAD